MRPRAHMRVQVCDDGCTEAVVDRENDGLMVCPISGRSTQRMVCDREDDDPGGGPAPEDGADGEAGSGMGWLRR